MRFVLATLKNHKNGLTLPEIVTLNMLEMLSHIGLAAMDALRQECKPKP